MEEEEESEPKMDAKKTKSMRIIFKQTKKFIYFVIFFQIWIVHKQRSTNVTKINKEINNQGDSGKLYFQSCFTIYNNK